LHAASGEHTATAVQDNETAIQDDETAVQDDQVSRSTAHRTLSHKAPEFAHSDCNNMTSQGWALTSLGAVAQTPLTSLNKLTPLDILTNICVPDHDSDGGGGTVGGSETERGRVREREGGSERERGGPEYNWAVFAEGCAQDVCVEKESVGELAMSSSYESFAVSLSGALHDTAGGQLLVDAPRDSETRVAAP